ncbi:hypothetical protein Tco_0552335, partial [Tanacetum coccineum]
MVTRWLCRGDGGSAVVGMRVIVACGVGEGSGDVDDGGVANM